MLRYHTELEYESGLVDFFKKWVEPQQAMASLTLRSVRAVVAAVIAPATVLFSVLLHQMI